MITDDIYSTLKDAGNQTYKPKEGANANDTITTSTSYGQRLDQVRTSGSVYNEAVNPNGITLTFKKPFYPFANFSNHSTGKSTTDLQKEIEDNKIDAEDAAWHREREAIYGGIGTLGTIGTLFSKHPALRALEGAAYLNAGLHGIAAAINDPYISTGEKWREGLISGVSGALGAVSLGWLPYKASKNLLTRSFGKVTDKLFSGLANYALKPVQKVGKKVTQEAAEKTAEEAAEKAAKDAVLEGATKKTTALGDKVAKFAKYPFQHFGTTAYLGNLGYYGWSGQGQYDIENATGALQRSLNPMLWSPDQLRSVSNLANQLVIPAILARNHYMYRKDVPKESETFTSKQPDGSEVTVYGPKYPSGNLKKNDGYDINAWRAEKRAEQVVKDINSGKLDPNSLSDAQVSILEKYTGQKIKTTPKNTANAQAAAPKNTANAQAAQEVAQETPKVAQETPKVANEKAEEIKNLRKPYVSSSLPVPLIDNAQGADNIMRNYYDQLKQNNLIAPVKGYLPAPVKGYLPAIRPNNYSQGADNIMSNYYNQQKQNNFNAYIAQKSRDNFYTPVHANWHPQVTQPAKAPLKVIKTKKPKTAQIVEMKPKPTLSTTSPAKVAEIKSLRTPNTVQKQKKNFVSDLLGEVLREVLRNKPSTLTQINPESKVATVKNKTHYKYKGVTFEPYSSSSTKGIHVYDKKGILIGTILEKQKGKPHFYDIATKKMNDNMLKALFETKNPKK